MKEIMLWVTSSTTLANSLLLVSHGNLLSNVYQRAARCAPQEKLPNLEPIRAKGICHAALRQQKEHRTPHHRGCGRK